MSATKEIHVYAADGFESAHRSETAARLAAIRGSKRRRVEYRIYRCSSLGVTSATQGTLIAVYRRGDEVAAPEQESDR